MMNPALETPSVPGAQGELQAGLSAARRARIAWSTRSIRERCALLRRFRHLAAEHTEQLAAVCSPSHEDQASAVSAEVLPLLDACHFLERRAPALLATRRPPRAGRSSWLGRIDFEIARDPLGVILVVGPANYPLFLPGVQLLQALAAGNAVAVKPAPGSTAAIATLSGLLEEAGLDPALLVILPEDVASVAAALEAGVDKVILTGSSETARRVYEICARALVPLTAELSGCDPCFVLPGADLDRVVEALRFGLLLNGARTCIAPRRVLADRSLAAQLSERMSTLVRAVAPIEVDAALQPRVRALLDDATAHGARVIRPEGADRDTQGPFLVLEGRPEMALFRDEVFAPILGILVVDDPEQGLALDATCPHALGASVFGPTKDARAFARHIDAGFVAVNDLIVPSADPRVPFGARKASGFGTTRGGEGLAELTAPRVIAVRGRGRLRHLEPRDPADGRILGALARLLHGRGGGARLHAIRDLLSAARKRGRHAE